MTPLTAIATSVAHPRVRSPRWAVTFPTMRSTELTATSSSLLQQETEHQGADGHEDDVEREEQPQPRPGLAGPAGCGKGGGPHPGHEHGSGQWEHQEREHRLARSGGFGEYTEQAPHGGEPDRAEHEGGGQRQG